MATTRIIPMHQNKGKTIRQCLSDRLDYGKNPDKTQEGQLISAYACDPETADAEFALSKREYFQLTGRRQDSDVIAYQVRQSFRPGEITPEEANRIGYEFAERFLKGNHAFNDTLSRLLANKEALDALMKIEGFRSLNQDIETIINKSEKVKKAKKEQDKLTPKEKKEISDEEKEYKSMRKQIQEKLIKFATRIPVFMYLTDYRERTLKDVITQLEPGLFKKVTGLDVPDFEMLCTLGVFNASLMNDAIFKFKRYEDSSLSYTGIDKHEGMDVGGWDTVLKKAEYEELFYNQQATMEAPVVEQPETVLDIPVSKPVPKVTPISSKPKNTYVTGQYGVKPTASMVAEKPAPYGVKPQQPKKEEPKVDLSGAKEGALVIHKAFGEGTITKIDKAQKHIRVKFKVGEKTFLFPDAFIKGFLKMKE